MQRAFVVSLIGLLCGVCACGEGPPSKSGSSNNLNNTNNTNNTIVNNDSGIDPDASTLFAALADGVCDGMFDCPTVVFDELFPKFESRAQCKEELVDSGFFNAAGLSTAFSSGRAQFDQFRVGACVDSVVDSICDEGFLNGRTPACLEAVSGQVAEGDSCATDEECEGRLTCERNPDSEDVCDLSCEVETCDGDVCEEDEYCNAGSCLPFKSTPEGQVCTGILDCEGRAICAAGLCTPLVLAQQDEECHPFSFVLNTSTTLSAVGVCGPSAFCKGGDATEAGTCQPIRGQDELCTSRGECISGLRCSTDGRGSEGQCGLPLEVGEVCRIDQDCATDWCFNSVCRERGSQMCSVDD